MIWFRAIMRTPEHSVGILALPLQLFQERAKRPCQPGPFVITASVIPVQHWHLRSAGTSIESYWAIETVQDTSFKGG